MRKSTIIATCLVNLRCGFNLESAEHKVRQIFAEEFPHADFDAWNQDINDAAANRLIKDQGNLSSINVRNVILAFG
ncbi:hypothetical protein BCO18442_03505 [Burkholderia contaminans]|nr:hypothetical protein BCO18442_03505 [Burkholderia contaminans]